MINWRSFTDNPNNHDALKRLDSFLRTITKLEETSRQEMILDFCRGREVLDIGAAGHTIQHKLEGWTHGSIHEVSKRAVAIDISLDKCKHYNQLGFDFRCVDATSNIDLGERFDRVFIGDVIEHVNDPILLFVFARRHLKSEGRILVTTPNPFAPRFRRHRRKRKTKFVMANLEHTHWISITNIHEIAWRANLELSVLRWPLLRKPKNGFQRNISINSKKALLAFLPIEEVFNEYVFELKVSD